MTNTNTPDNFRSDNFRSDNSRNKLRNPFKYRSIVDEPYFTNRVKELEQIKSILNSDVHLIMMSPRRYGKTSLIMKGCGTHLTEQI